MSNVTISLHREGYLMEALALSDAAALLAYRQQTRERLRQWSPLRDDVYFTLEGVRDTLRALHQHHEHGTGLYLVVKREVDHKIVGECSFSNIMRGPFQAAYLGFSVDASEEGKGLMRVSLEAAIQFAFNEMGLHRIMANYRPENRRSAVLLNRLGFEQEGTARRYLKINGAWADHILTAKINGQMD